MPSAWKPFRANNEIWADGDLKSVSYSKDIVRLEWVDFTKSKNVIVFEGVDSFSIDLAAIEAGPPLLDGAQSKTVNAITTLEIILESEIVLSITYGNAKTSFQHP